MKAVMKRILASILTFILVFSIQPDIEFIKNDDVCTAVQLDAGPERISLGKKTVKMNKL